MKARVTLAVLAASAICAVPAAAEPVTETATSGATTATLGYDESRDGISSVRITVVRAGVTLVDEAGPRFPRCTGEFCEYAPRFAHVDERSIFVRNLDLDSEPEVLADFFTGGANCCAASNIYDFDPATGRYDSLKREWRTGDYGGAKDLDRDGAAELIAADGRFEGRYGCSACTPQPLRIFALRDGALTVVTGRYRRRVRRELRTLRATYERFSAADRRLAGRGFIAAVVADHYTLGEGRKARRLLRSELRRGRLEGPGNRGAAGARAFVRSLLRFLARAGYR